MAEEIIIVIVAVVLLGIVVSMLTIIVAVVCAIARQLRRFGTAPRPRFPWQERTQLQTHHAVALVLLIVLGLAILGWAKAEIIIAKPGILYIAQTFAGDWSPKPPDDALGPRWVVILGLIGLLLNAAPILGIVYFILRLREWGRRMNDQSVAFILRDEELKIEIRNLARELFPTKMENRQSSKLFYNRITKIFDKIDKTVEDDLSDILKSKESLEIQQLKDAYTRRTKTSSGRPSRSHVNQGVVISPFLLRDEELKLELRSLFRELFSTEIQVRSISDEIRERIDEIFSQINEIVERDLQEILKGREEQALGHLRRAYTPHL